jgi:hypothetical protein
VIGLLPGGAGLLFWLTALMQFVEARRIELDKPEVAS